MSPTTPPRPEMPLPEAARRLKLSHWRAYNALLDGRLEGRREGRHWIVSEDSVARLEAELRRVDAAEGQRAD